MGCARPTWLYISSNGKRTETRRFITHARTPDNLVHRTGGVGVSSHRIAPCAQAERDAVSTAVVDGNGDDDDDDGDGDAAPPGVVLRTDYTAGSDEAWASFCGMLRDGEREFLADQEGSGSTSASTSAPDDDDGDVEMAPAPASHSLVPASAESGDDDDDDDEGEGGSEEAEKELALFSLVSDSTRFDGISNLRALRLLFDVSVRTAPTLPSPLGSAHPQHQPKQQQRQDQHRLTCQRGLQETYDARGRTLWIFDARSRIDGCARLVSEAGDVATLAYQSSSVVFVLV